MLEYGPVLITGGRHKGRIMVYDDDASSSLILYSNNPAFCTNMYKINSKNVTSTIPTEYLAKRWEELDQKIADANCTGECQDKLIELLHERILVSDLLNDRFFYAMHKIQKNENPEIFISHSSKDSRFVKCIATDLLKEGYSVFLDEWSINVGDRLFNKINDGLDKSTAFIMIISKDYLESVCCKDEWADFYSKTLANENNRIYPLIIDDSNPPALISQIKYLKINDYNYSQQLELLLQSLKKQFSK